MTKINWKHVVRTRVGMKIEKWFSKNGVKTYEEAENILRKNGFPMGSREEVASFLPSTQDTTSSGSDSDTSSGTSSRRSSQKVSTSKKPTKTPKSPGEAAADAITKSNAVKSPKETKKPKRTRKRKPK
jgi:hypothetical protein